MMPFAYYTKMKSFFSKLTFWHWLCGLAVVLVSFSPVLTGLVGIRALLPKHTLFYGAVTPFLLAYFDKHNFSTPSSLKVFGVIVAFLFSQFVTIEGSFYHVHSWALCFGSWTAVLTWLLRTLVYGYVFYRITVGIYCIIERNKTHAREDYRIDYRKWFLLIVGARLFAMLLFYPLVFGFDATVGLRTFMDPDCATCNHHPYFIQVIHALFFNLGKSIGHLSVGFALLALISIFSTSAILLYGLRLMQRARISRRWLVAITMIYAFSPIYPYLSINPTKDGLFAYAFLFYILSLYELCITKGDCLNHKRYMLLHGAAIILVCLTRHQGIYIIGVELIALLLCYRNVWKRILLTAIPSLCLVMAYNKILLPFNNVEPGGKQEVYGTFFQQTAYYLLQHPNDVTSSELSAINRVLDSDTIVVKYMFDRTDPVKNGYKYNPWYRKYIGAPSMFRHIDHTNEAADLKAYRSAWLSMGLRHPLSYVEATLGVAAGFFYNFNRLILETEPKWAVNSAATTPPYRFVHFNMAARVYNQRIYSWFKYPVLNWIIAIPYYNWAAIFLLALLFYRKDSKGLTVFLPVLLSLGILLICPMIYGRYSYPIMMALPLMVAHVFHSQVPKRQEQMPNNND